MKTNKNWPVIIPEKTSHKCWSNGAYSLCFVYSNKGNFLLKGYVGDITNYLNELKTQGYKFFYNLRMYSNGESRGYWTFYNRNTPEGCTIIEPDIRDKQYHFRVTNFDNIDLKFKRLPNKWIKEFDNL